MEKRERAGRPALGDNGNTKMFYLRVSAVLLGRLSVLSPEEKRQALEIAALIKITKKDCK